MAINLSQLGDSQFEATQRHKTHAEQSRWEQTHSVRACPHLLLAPVGQWWGVVVGGRIEPWRRHLMSWVLALSLPLWDLGQITLHL